MRILRLTAAAAAITAAVLVDPRAASAFQPPNQPLTLSPSSGPRTTSITATYVFSPQGQPNARTCALEFVTFTWDWSPLGARQAGPAADQGYCVATLPFNPPGGHDSPGEHSVHATGGKTTGAATFTITGDPEPSPVPPPPSANPPGSAPSTSTSTASPSDSVSPSSGLASALPSTSTSESAEPLPSEVPSFEASPAVVGAAINPPSGTSLGMIIAIIVGAMTIAGAGLLIGLAMQNRPDTDEISTDGLTAEP